MDDGTPAIDAVASPAVEVYSAAIFGHVSVMPRIPRQLLVDPTEVGVYHCIKRCVRRAFLCGRDPATGKSFEHRKDWIQNRLQFLAGQFGIDVLDFAVMSNHLHVVLCNRPGVVRGWSDREVALRWWHLFPTHRDDNDADEDHSEPLEPTESDLGMILNDPKRLAEIRSRLSSIPWFMRCLAEPIARQSNKEDQCTGRFWEGRCKCRLILDESALADCLTYVDLNPVRAGVAKTPETSRFTSVFERIQARREAGESQTSSLAPAVSIIAGKPESMAAQGAPGNSRTRSGGSPGAPGSPSRVGASPSRKNASAMSQQAAPAKPARDQWLSPLPVSAEIARVPVPAGRASNTGCLAMTLDDYLRLVDWTGRQVRREKKGAIPADVAPVLDRLQISGESWLELIAKFGRLFRRAAGRPESLRRDAEKRHVKRTEGIVNSRALFA